MKKFLIIILSVFSSVVSYAQTDEDMLELYHSLRSESFFLDRFDVQADSVLALYDQQIEAYRSECKSLRTLLYGTKYDYIFDITWALNQVRRMDERLEENSNPAVAYLERAYREIERDSLLRESLMEMPRTVMRDSSIYYLDRIVASHRNFIAKSSLMDSNYYHLRQEFAATVAYAEERQQMVQNTIFYECQDDYLTVLIPEYRSFVKGSIQEKISFWSNLVTRRDIYILFVQTIGIYALLMLVLRILTVWGPKKHLRFYSKKGFFYANFIWLMSLVLCLILDIYVLQIPILTSSGMIFFIFLGFVMVMMISSRVDHTERQSVAAIQLYMPAIISTFCIALLRVLFAPDVLLTFTLFPIAAISFVWQLLIFISKAKTADKVDVVFSFISMIVFLLAALSTAIGYVFWSLQLLYAWQSELGLLLAALTIYRLLLGYKSSHFERDEDMTIGFRFVMDVLVPYMVIMTVPFCIYMSLDIFNGGSTFDRIFFDPFYTKMDGDVVVATLSAYNVAWVVGLFFMFRFLSAVIAEAYCRVRIDIERHRRGRRAFRTNEINLTLGRNLITLFVWFVYLVLACNMLTIPMSSLAFVMTGLAAGIGFAMKDVLNNIIYGAQLMSGRVRVGDLIECDGLTGTVVNISYQSTQIKIWDGSVVHIANATLFDKNFKNFTRTTEYRRISIPFSVAYGSDIARTREVTRIAIEGLIGGVDEFGRSIYRPGSVEINFLDMADSGINFDARIDVLHEKRWKNLSEVRQTIYEALNREGIEIPFPQVDVHMR